jgi:hypothetical protein
MIKWNKMPPSRVTTTKSLSSLIANRSLAKTLHPSLPLSSWNWAHHHPSSDCELWASSAGPRMESQRGQREGHRLTDQHLHGQACLGRRDFSRLDQKKKNPLDQGLSLLPGSSFCLKRTVVGHKKCDIMVWIWNAHPKKLMCWGLVPHTEVGIWRRDCITSVSDLINGL